MDRDEFIKVVDAIVKEAYMNGFSTDFSKYMDWYAVKGRLELYGSIIDDKYYLNELGLKYAMDGCSEGIERRLKLESYQATIDMKAIAEEANRIANHANLKAKCANTIAIWAIIAAFVVPILIELLKVLMYKIEC